MRPNACMVSSIRRLMSSFDEMLAAIAMARPLPCLASIACTTSRQAGSLREDTTTRAPCSAMRSAMARPMPRDEPVMTATLPSRLNNDMSVSLYSMRGLDPRNPHRGSTALSAAPVFCVEAFGPDRPRG